MGLFRSRFQKPPSAVVHSNGFAEAADSGAPTFGSTSSETFSQRRAIDNNRSHIDRFQNARIHHDYRTPRTTSSLPDQPSTGAPEQHVPTAPTRLERSSIPRASGSYREPSSRGFNPFR